MVETLKEVIARLKAQQVSQKSEPKVVPSPKPIEIEEEEEDSEEILEEPKNNPVKTPKPQQTGENEEITDKQREQILMEIEMLQNNGRYRVELLHQMQEMNKALIVIAGILTDISGNKK